MIEIRRATKVELKATPRFRVTPVISPSTARWAWPRAVTHHCELGIEPIRLGFGCVVSGVGGILDAAGGTEAAKCGQHDPRQQQSLLARGQGLDLSCVFARVFGQDADAVSHRHQVGLEELGFTSRCQPFGGHDRHGPQHEYETRLLLEVTHDHPHRPLLNVLGVSCHEGLLLGREGIGSGSDHGDVESVDDDQSHYERGELEDEVD